MTIGQNDLAAALAEGDHRLANSLSLTAALLGMQRRASREPAVRDAIHDAEMRVASIARFHAYLHETGHRERVDLAACLRSVTFEIMRGIGVDCHLDLVTPDPVWLSGETAMQILVVIDELALNAAKHGRSEGGGGEVTIRLEHPEGGAIRIEVADGGRGLPEGFDADATTGLGLRVVRSIVRQHGGTLRCWTDGGARFAVTLP